MMAKLRVVLVGALLVTGGVLAAQEFDQSTTTTTTDTTSESTTNVEGEMHQTGNAGSFSGTVTTTGSSHEESSSESSGSSFSMGNASDQPQNRSLVPVLAAPQPRAHGKNSCSVPNNHQCAGCAISCPDGQQASCTGSNRGIFTDDDDSICPTKAKCVCK
jgi:hypothetical protein